MTTRAVSEPVAPEPVQLPSLLAPSPAVLPATPTATSQAGPGALCLVDAQTGQRYVLQAGVTTIGRASDNNIVLNGATVSSYHAEVRYENGQYVLHDKDSRNGQLRQRPAHQTRRT